MLSAIGVLKNMNKLKYPDDFINKIICGDCLEVMKQMPDDSIDLVVTSPPYDNLRDYHGYSFDFENIARELFRIMSVGGIIVWVVGDAVVNGSESGTSFRQALYFKEIGFNIHDTMIYAKKGCPFPEQNRYNQKFEYMFIVTKNKPKTVNLLKQKTLYNKKQIGNSRNSTTRNKNGKMEKKKYETNKEYCTRYNIWEYAVGYMKSSNDLLQFKHPATFPEKLAQEHILSWSNENDIVLDIFNGSGTTTKAAQYLHRKFIGIEIDKKYCEIARQRLRQKPLL